MSALATVAPEWIRPSLTQKDGRDPLGLQTTTQDRLMPALMPDVNELTRRARYLSFYAFLLQQYQRERRKLARGALSEFIKAREWELGLAVRRCPNACGSSPVGATRLRGVTDDGGELPRGESVESSNGGYGLYYRSSMIAFDLSMPAGSSVGDTVAPIDVISPRDRANQLAGLYRDSIAGTEYFTRYWSTTDPIPVSVIEEFASVACLCRLDEFTDERSLIISAMFEAPDPGVEDATAQRRRSFAHYLTLLESDPQVQDDELEFRRALWDVSAVRSDAHRDVSDRWAALVVKDLFQDAVCSLWTHLLRASYAAGGLDGLNADGLTRVVDSLAGGQPAMDGSGPTSKQVRELAWPMEHPELLRRQVAEADSATAGVAGLVALAGLVASRDTVGWREATSVESAWQPSVLQVAHEVERHLATSPTVRETVEWALRRFVITPHERIAYSKLPEFTFRFRSGPGGLRFFDLNASRFILAAIRHESLATLTRDLGLRDDGELGAVTARGKTFVETVLG